MLCIIRMIMHGESRAKQTQPDDEAVIRVLPQAKKNSSY
jgi:hypothetical protein